MAVCPREHGFKSAEEMHQAYKRRRPVIIQGEIVPEQKAPPSPEKENEPETTLSVALSVAPDDKPSSTP